MEDLLDYSQLSDYELAAFAYHQANRIYKMSYEEFTPYIDEFNKRSALKKYDLTTLREAEDLKENPLNKPKCPNCKTLKSKETKPNDILEFYSLFWAYHFGRYSIRKYYQCIICRFKYSVPVL